MLLMHSNGAPEEMFWLNLVEVSFTTCSGTSEVCTHCEGHVYMISTNKLDIPNNCPTKSMSKTENISCITALRRNTISTAKDLVELNGTSQVDETGG